MFRRKTPRVATSTVALAMGATAGTAVAVYLAVRQVRSRRAARHEMPPSEFAAQEQAAVDALREDGRLGRRPIDVAAVGAGIIELTGAVETAEEAHNAVELVQRLDGVHTVINRLTVGDIEQHLAETRGRLRAGDPRLQETQWYGMRIGMGRRRQSPSTDPDRPDDRTHIVSRELEPDPAAVMPDELDEANATELSREEADRRPMRRGRRGRPR